MTESETTKVGLHSDDEGETYIYEVPTVEWTRAREIATKEGNEAAATHLANLGTLLMTIHDDKVIHY